MPKLIFVLLALALVLGTVSARGAGRRVALLGADHELERAVALALSAWDVETLALAVRFSEDSGADARTQAAGLARLLLLDAVVWVAPEAEGSRLFVFDAHTGELTVRSLPERPPFASATAAGLALSVKTALRPSVEPANEPPAPRQPATLPPPHAPHHAQALSASRLPRVSLRATLAADYLAENKAQARAALGTTLWFGAERRAGLALRFSAGSNVSFETAELAGRYRDLGFSLAGEYRWLERGAVSSAFGLGAGLRTAMLEGTLSADGGHVAVTRYNPSVNAGFRLDVRVFGDVFVGIELSSDLFVRYQRYLVLGRTVFAPFRLSPSAGASLGIALF